MFMVFSSMQISPEDESVVKEQSAQNRVTGEGKRV